MRSTNDKSRSTIIFLAVAILVVVNGIGFLIYSSSTSGEQVDQAASALPATTTAATTTTPTVEDDPAVQRKVDALRKKALDHLVADEYQQAVDLLGKALTLSSNQRDLPDLLNMAKSRLEAQREAEALATKDTSATQRPGAAVPTPAVEPTPVVATRSVSRRRPNKSNRSSKKAPTREPAVKTESVEETPKMGTLVVVSAPKMAFTIDGAVQGITPKEIQVTPGTSHTITFLHNSRTLARRRVSVQAGKMAYIDEDLSAEIAEIDAVAKAKEDAVASREKEVAVVKPVLPTPTVEPKKVAVAATGELHIVSPNVYGEIFVNGKSYGMPPRVIKNLPIGAAKVEIRVQGKARRAKMVKVTKGKRESLRFR